MYILITGGTSGLGFYTAMTLAEDQNNKILLIGSNKVKGVKAVEEIIKKTKNKKIKYLEGDLSSIKQISMIAKNLIKEKFDILINNAGALYFSRMESIDKIEKTFALNHLSYFALTNLLLQNKNIKRDGRIINVASGAHKGIDIDFEDLETKKNYNGWFVYKKSKLCNILFTRKLSKFTSDKNITVNCLHPGFVKTSFGTNNTGVIGLIIKFLMTLFAIKVEEGAETIIYLATSNNVKNISGEYFYQSKINKPSNFAENNKSADDLWDLSIKILKNNNLTL